MTALEWDKVGERFFQTGVDRGVLYLVDGRAIPWNGLTQVTETLERDVKSFFIDGVKYLDHQVPSAFAGKVEAFTYPDELEDVLGNEQFAPGVFLHDQRAKLFNLSYRTLIGNDVDGTDHGYKLHIMYNLIASPTSVGMASVGSEVSPAPFSWSLTGTPPIMFGARPTCHISLDSRLINPDFLNTVEALLYGTEGTDPALPSLVDLLGMAEGT